MAKLDPSALSRWQGPIQAFLRPAAWIPGYRNVRYHAEKWTSSVATSEAYEVILQACNTFRQERSLLKAYVVIHKANKNSAYIELHTYTPSAEWLDVVQIKLIPRTSGCVINIRSFSSGFLPTKIPLAPILNIAFFWIPFLGQDQEGWTNSRRIKVIHDAVAERLQLS